MLTWLRSVPRCSLVFLAIAAFGAACVFVLNSGVKGPMIQGDEGSYLANAAAIAGFANDFASSYHAGYSLLISPAFRSGSDPEQVWQLVLLINSVLFGWMVWLLGRLSGLLAPTAGLGERVAAVVLVSAYPMWVVLAGYSFAQIAVVPFYLLLVLLTAKSLQTQTPLHWLLSGVVASFLYWIHPTAIPAAIALVIVSGLAAWQSKRPLNFVVLLATLFVGIWLYRSAFTPFLNDRMTISGFAPNLHYPGLSRFFYTFRSVEGFLDTIGRAGGHIFYLSIGTVGLVWIGVFALSSRVFEWGKSSSWLQRVNPLHLFVLLAFVGTLALSVLFFQNAPRLDHWMYGRYVEPFIAPVLLAGALAPKWRVGLVAVPIAAVCAWLFSVRLDTYTHIAFFNVSAFWQFFKIGDYGIGLWLLSGIVLIALASSMPRRFGIAVVFSVFVFAASLQLDWHERAAANAGQRWEAARAIRDRFDTGFCVGFDHSGITSYHRHVFWFDFALQLYDFRLKRMSEEGWRQGCEGPLISYATDLHQRGITAHPIALSRQQGPVVWMHGSPDFEEVFPLEISNRDPDWILVLGEGWHALESSLVWSTEQADLYLPIENGRCDVVCEVELHFDVFGASEQRPVEVVIFKRGADLVELGRQVFRAQGDQQMRLSFAGLRQGMQRISVQVEDAVSPRELVGAQDERVLGIGLRALDVVTPGIVMNEFTPATSTEVGSLDQGVLSSTSRSGFLLFGPYASLAPGKYRLILNGKVQNSENVRIDVVSSRGSISHGEFRIESDAPIGGVILDETIFIDAHLADAEVRVWVGDASVLSVSSYSLVPDGR